MLFHFTLLEIIYFTVITVIHLVVSNEYFYLNFIIVVYRKRSKTEILKIVVIIRTAKMAILLPALRAAFSSPI